MSKMLQLLCHVTVLVSCFICSSGYEGCVDPNAVPGCNENCDNRCPNPNNESLVCRCPEENSCECKDGFFFDTITYSCVKSCNGDVCRGYPNTVPGCDENCEKRCPNPKNESFVCSCPEENSCECKDGFFFDPITYSCVKNCNGDDSNNCTEEAQCPEALERFTDAVLRTTSKALKAYADSTCETGSISTISSMFLLATFAVYASGQTKNEISRVLNLWTYDEIMCVTSKLNNEAINITGCAEFAGAPCIFANNRYPLTPAFMKTVDVITLDGLAKNIDSSQSEQFRNAINQILAQKTRNRVTTAVPDNFIFDSSTQLVAISALYLMGGWEIEFQRTNEVTQFRTSPTESEKQTFMYQDAEYNYAHSELLGAKVVEVNMCLNQLSLWILLPDCPFTESAMIDKMAENPDWYYNIKETMNRTRLDLYIPFHDKIATVNSAYILQKATNMTTIFNNETIELKGVTEGDIQVAVSAGVQTSYLMYTFEGDPVPDGIPNGPKMTLKADYPFAFMIFRYGRVYFAGTFRRAVA